MKQGRWSMFAAGAVTLILLGASGSLGAQGTVTGRITDAATTQPLGSVQVMVVGTNIGGLTNDDGRYTLRGVPAGNQELQVLRVGYQSQKKRVTIEPGSTANNDFQLKVSVVQLGEIVTTATGQQRRVELGNAVATLGNVGKKVEEQDTPAFADLLLAKTPGVIALPATTLGGAPTIRVRGLSSISLSNAPIYYLDGVRYSAGNSGSGTDTPFSLLNALNPDDIEDVEIVKGPSAATLYGTNAANGVVLITTKKGKSGATHWNYFGEDRTLIDQTPYQPMYARWGHAPGGTAQIRCQLSTMTTPKFAGNCVTDSITSYNLLRDPSRTLVKWGRGFKGGASVNGGSDIVRYFVSGSVDNEYGPVQMPDLDVRRFNDSLKVGVRPEWFHPLAQDQVNFRSNISAALSPKFDLSTSMGFTKTNNRIPPESDLIIALWYTQMQNYGFKGPGLDKVTNQVDGTPLNDAFQWNPGDVMQYVNSQDLQRFTGSVNANWRPFSWLQNDATLGTDLTDLNFFHLCRLNECPPQSATARVGNVTDNRANLRNFNFKLSSTATWNFRPWLNLRTSVGADYTNIEVDSLNTRGQTLPPGAVAVTQAATKLIDQESQPKAVKTLGLYVQEQAAVNDRLFLTAALRTDQNSAFGTKFQRVYYPKASASWIASDEPAFPKMNWLDQLRLRVSYGASGVQPGPIAGLTLFSANTVTIATRGLTSGTDTPGLISSNPGNANLKPETSAEFESGFEMRLFRRVSVDYTYYDKRTKDALINIPLAPSGAASVTQLLTNIGRIRNWGHELQVNMQLWDSRNFGWDMTVGGSHNSSLVLDLGTDATTCKIDASGAQIPGSCQDRVIGAGGQTREVKGYPIFSQWFRPYTYRDDNGDGILQVSEVHVDSAFKFVGYGAPRDIFSVQQGFDLLNHRLRVTLSFDYKGGGNTIDGANNFQCNTTPLACAENEIVQKDLNLQARQIAKSNGTVLGGTTFKTSRGYFISDQFWKFREASVIYNLPVMLMRRIGAGTGSTLVFSVRNIHTWTNFTGIDPEANYGVSSTSELQNEFQTAGIPTYYTFRLNLKY
ncbi:MAG TPA: SusC/RagA family TonB-linked outer membrane protein [Gemmatimonadaceae bacterium]|nr:SusC/RagA family TonB-linked outer membrane protein [Gemmatimonadaceae bacterium]